MSTNTATSPASTPEEAPKPELVFDNVAAQTDRELSKLKQELGINETTPDEKHKEYEAVEAFFREKKDTIKKITREEINNIKTSIHDENQELGGTLNVTTDGSLELNETTNTTSDTPPETTTEAPPTATPEPAEAVTVDTETKEFLEQISQKPIENRGNGVKEFVINILKGFTDIPFIGGIISGMLLKLEGYTSSTEKLQVAETIMSIQSAMNAVGAGKTAQRLGELPPQEQRGITNVILQHEEFYDNVSLMIIPSKIVKYFKNIMVEGGIEKYKQPSLSQTIIKMVEGNEPSEVLATEEEPVASVVATTETQEEVTESQNIVETMTPLGDVLSRYDGRPYEEESESASKDTIFTFEQDDIFLSIKRGDQKETANINPDGTLTYRGIKGTPEMIIQLARLDMYMVSFKGSVELADNNNLTGENKIEKFYNDVDGQGVNNRIVTASVDEIPAFLQGWDWQKLELFLLRDSARQIAPAEAAEMSGEKPESITQEDLDILMQRTDVREDKNDAKFRGASEEDGSITITRATPDGEKKWDESIFPNADGTYTIGNVRFPNITDAIKAANMRNWVRWHDGEGRGLQEDVDNIEVNGFFNDTNLIEEGKIPEFLTHGVLPDTGNALTNLSDVYDFLKGAVIDDGVYGKNKTRTKWESEQVTNT